MAVVVSTIRREKCRTTAVSTLLTRRLVREVVCVCVCVVVGARRRQRQAEPNRLDETRRREVVVSAAKDLE